MIYKLFETPDNIDIEDDFWKDNQQLKYIEPFKSLYDRDDTINKSQSSKEMFCIWMIEDPSYRNKVGKMPADQKKSTILSYNPDFDLNDPIIVKCLEQYNDLCLSPAARAFKVAEETLYKRAAFLAEAEYKFPEPILNESGKQVYVGGRPAMTGGTVKEIEAMHKATSAVIQQYDKSKKIFEEEQAQIRIFGGGKETLMESNGLTNIPDDIIVVG